MEEMIYSVLTIYLCSIFLFSSVFKFLRLPSFVVLVEAYGVLPSPYDRIFGYLLPPMELLGAGLLLFQSTAVWGSFLLMGLLLCFACAIGSVIRSGRVISCGCYGSFMEAQADGWALTKIGFLFALCTVLAWGHHFSDTIHFRPPLITVGVTAALLTLLVQKVWSSHQKALSKLKYLQKRSSAR
ncbi:methylamine utilization protein MauE [Melghirimyces profundicolus]|uniref:Methylamine utilization protein MauE n=1 Tax=Melghirimyces profundicolus TaxID=1242148 RepID=A0A2T6C7W6_9BACL|nr:MauE/DoxX family redox-associated membrane protein [Melghirimyces profundicolus]PTX64409.1 methylamine utilization protein MauE [Melghirimyces profundicolus]